MGMHPASVMVGSIICNLERPDKALSPFTPVIHEWPQSTQPTRRDSSHSNSDTKGDTIQADTPLFTTTAKNAVGRLPLAGQNTPAVSFSATEITTRRFAPSAKYVRAAVADQAVATFLQAGGSGARVYLFVGVKVAREVTVVCADSQYGGTCVGTLGCYERAEYPRPVVFGVEVEELRLAQDGEIVRKDLDTLEETTLPPVQGKGIHDDPHHQALTLATPTKTTKTKSHEWTALQVLIPLLWAASQERKPVTSGLLRDSNMGAAPPAGWNVQMPLIWAALGDIPPPGHGMTIPKGQENSVPKEKLVARYKAQTWTNKTDRYLEEWNKGSAQRRFRVLIVDTSIDLNSPYITLDAEHVRFVRGGAAENQDYEGHGTLIAHLLLRLSQNIIVYVHKIAESRKEMCPSAERIAELSQ
ncbi:hypothetical protein C8A05DRAFT_39208 [Staphylotrichum tortipilum]|uniref:Peptidase S8/S53 domain-containing protein n=1 Tax=Staphylotrichum tortipilum TaxID=2831512 RepID=A0AAN6MC43_9PEZI|nr:hypothetical protein C8A05DRAFT_39208 [Staphylotrichum longicolle]